MNDAQGEGKGDKAKAKKKTESAMTANEREVQTIEYLIYQSTQGIHFLFNNDEIEAVMRMPDEGEAFFSIENMTKVQALLTQWLERPTFSEKRSFLDSLAHDQHAMLIRAYFHLVDTTIMTHSNLRH